MRRSSSPGSVLPAQAPSPEAWREGGGVSDCRRPPRHRLTLAPSSVEEVLVEDADDDDSSALDESCGQGTPSANLSHPFISKEADSELLETKLKEDFWSEVGFPAGSRWWEECSATSAISVTKNPNLEETDLETTKIIVEPKDVAAVLPGHRAPKGIGRIFFNRRLGRVGVPMRPWRGPLPRPRPAAAAVLGDFLPIQLQSETETKSTENLTGIRPLILGHDELILRAKSFGRPLLNLETHRASRVAPRKIQLPPSPSSSRLTPPPCEAGSPLISNGKPTYAAMAARPPPTGARGPAHRGPPRGAAGAGSSGGQPPPPSGPANAQQRRETAYGGQNYGGGYRPQHRYDGGDRRGEWRPTNRPPNRPTNTDRRPIAEQSHVVHLSGTRTGESSQQQASTDQDQAMKKAKKPRIPHCFRCKCNGHIAEVCTANLDCVICNKKDSHLSRKCPIVKMPKPNATFFGIGKSDFSFLKMPEFDYKLEEPVPAPTALVTIAGGQLSAKALEAELTRLMRLDWQWEALAHGENSFLVPFPSEEELKRINDVEFRLKHLGVTVTFSEWMDGQEAVPSYELETVWLHITGIPHSWRHYLSFWAVGTVVGSTLQVDMHTFRRKGVVRVQVGVLNKDKFPYTTDLVFGQLGYDITFSLEPEDFVPAVAPLEDHVTVSDNGQGEENKAPDGGDQSKLKKQKMTESPQGEIKADGPVPMQLALTPFPPNVDVGKILQAMKSQEKISQAERRDFLLTYKRRSATAKSSQVNTSAVCACDKNIQPENANPSNTDCVSQTASVLPSDCGRSEILVLDTGANSVNFTPLKPSDSHLTAARPVHSKAAIHAEAEVFQPGPETVSDSKQTGRGTLELADPSCETPARTTSNEMARGLVGRQEELQDLSKPAAEKPSVGSAQEIGNQSGATQLTDEDSLQKSMKRTAWKNLDGAIEQEKIATSSPSTTTSYSLGYPLASYLGCATEAYLPGVGFGYMSTIGAGGQGVFFPGTWVAI